MNDLLIYSLISFLLMFVCANISYKYKLVDLPNLRKIHSKSVVYTGGIGISLSLIFSIYFIDIPIGSLNNILSIAFLISLIGLIDDKLNLNVGSKLCLQIIPIFYLIIYGNLNLDHLGNYNYFIIQLGGFKLPFTLLCVLFLINSFNYFDGLDGTLSFASISVLAILYFLFSNQIFHLFLIILLIPIVIFILFNFSFLKLPKMFLGDSGSLQIGFIISFVLIYLGSQNLVHPILLAWSIVIFVYEFLSINFIRITKQQNPFKAGQDHLHHLFFRRTKSILLTNLIISLINIVFFMVGYFSFLFSPIFSLILFIILFFIFLALRVKFSKKNYKIKIH